MLKRFACAAAVALVPAQAFAGGDVFDDLYVQALAGIKFADEVTYACLDYDCGEEVDETNYGYAFGGAIGIVLQSLPYIAFELDALAALAEYTGYEGEYGLTTITAMGNVKFILPIDVVTLYAALGVGAMFTIEHDMIDDIHYYGFGPAYQLIVGGGFEIAEGITLIGEFRHQGLFTPAEVPDPDDSDPYSIDVTNNLFLFGIKVATN